MYVHRGEVTDELVGRLMTRLARTRAWGKLRKAKVFIPSIGRYVQRPQRTGLKAALRDDELVRILRVGVPPEVHIPDGHHVDLLRYAQGQRFDRHTDFVNTHPHDARQVTVLVGLRRARAGGTVLYTANGTAHCEETIRRGGLLIFDSALPHAGERVEGAKEVLAFIGFHFPPRRMERTGAQGRVTSALKCLAVCQEVVGDDAGPFPPRPWVHVYTEDGRRLASCDMEAGVCVRYVHQPGVLDANAEQLERIRTPHTGDVWASYPLLYEVLRRKRVCAMASAARRTRIESHVRHVDEREYCNAGDDYDTTHVTALRIHTACSRFEVAMYDRRYVIYWVDKIAPVPLAADVVGRICEYAEW